MGYVANLPDGWLSEKGRRRSSRKTKRSLPYVQAILAWETGEIDLTEYEHGVRDARGVHKAFV